MPSKLHFGESGLLLFLQIKSQDIYQAMLIYMTLLVPSKWFAMLLLLDAVKVFCLNCDPVSALIGLLGVTVLFLVLDTVGSKLNLL